MKWTLSRRLWILFVFSSAYVVGSTDVIPSGLIMYSTHMVFFYYYTCDISYDIKSSFRRWAGLIPVISYWTNCCEGSTTRSKQKGGREAAF